MSTAALNATTAHAALIPADAPNLPDRRSTDPTTPLPLLLTDRDGAALLRMGRTTFWRHVRNGNLPQPVRIGGLTRWNRAELEAVAAGKPAEAPAAPRRKRAA